MSFTEIFQYDFIVRALIVGSLVSLCAALLGVTLVLKRFSMIGDGLSHVGFGALSVSMALGFAPLIISTPIVILAAFLLLHINNNSKIKGDSAIAIIASVSLAAGVIVTSVTSGISVDVFSYMFGSVLAISDSDLIITVILSIVVLILYLIFYNPLFGVTFDESFSKAGGVNVSLYKMLIAFLTAITVVIGMRIMGTMLISSLIIFPALSSMRVFSSFRSVVISSAIISLICFLAGLYLSFIWNLPAGASVVMVNFAVFCIMWITGKITRRTA